MAAEISFVDKQDGTGVEITVTNLVDTPLVVHIAGFDGYVSQPFAVAATFNADGTQTIAMDNGPYQSIVTENGSPVGIYNFRVSNSWQATHYRCLVALRNYVLALSLPLYPSSPAAHKLHKRPIDTRKEFEKLVSGAKNKKKLFGVHYFANAENRRPGTNRSQFVEYPIQIVVVRTTGGSNVPESDWMLSRQILSRALHATALPGVPEIHTATVRPLSLYHEVDSRLHVDLQSLIVTCETDQCSVVS